MAELIRTSDVRRAWRNWLDHCANGAWANPQFFGRTIGGVPVPWVDPIEALEAALRATGYVPRSAWAYNFRGIGGATCTCSNSSRCSIHAYGVAIDIDPAENPYTSRPFSWDDTAFTPEQIAAVEAIRNIYGEQVFTWGGRWSSIRDYMHFQARVAPERTAIDWSTVPEIGDDEMSLRRGDNGRGVADVQRGLIETHGYDLGTWDPYPTEDGERPYPPGADGSFGATTEGSVADFQTGRELSTTGVVDGLTAALILDSAPGTGDGLTEAEADDRYAKKKHGHGLKNHGHEPGGVTEL